MTQEDFSIACGKRRRAQSTYESGERTPEAWYFERADKIGVDITYVITGKRQKDFEPTSDELDMDILEATLANLYLVEITVTSPWGTLSPKKKAQVVSMLYRAFKASGRVDSVMIEDAIKLAAG